MDKTRWIERAETEWGAWGAIYRDDDGTVIGSMQYGLSTLFPRAWELPAGPPSEDAVLVTCAYLVARASPWVMQSLFLAAIGDARDKRAGALETFAYRYPEAESPFSGSSSTAPCSRGTSSPISASGPFARRGQSSWRGSSSVGWSR